MSLKYVLEAVRELLFGQYKSAGAQTKSGPSIYRRQVLLLLCLNINTKKIPDKSRQAHRYGTPNGDPYNGFCYAGASGFC